MSLFPFSRYYFFDDPFFFNRLDFFDPWYDYHIFPLFSPITPRLRRMRQQERLTYSSTRRASSGNSLEQPTQSSPPEKFRVQSNIDGFNPDTIKQRIEGRKLIIEGKQEEHRREHDYTVREMRESYELPEHADTNRLSSYVTSNNRLNIEIPIQNRSTDRRLEQTQNTNQSLTQFGRRRASLFDDSSFISDSDIKPRIVDRGNNQKQLEMSVEMKNFRPEEINVSVKNNELIVQGEHQHEDANRSERSYFFKSTTLPRGTKVDQLQSRYNDDGQLKIEAPIL